MSEEKGLPLTKQRVESYEPSFERLSTFAVPNPPNPYQFNLILYPPPYTPSSWVDKWYVLSIFLHLEAVGTTTITLIDMFSDTIIYQQTFTGKDFVYIATENELRFLGDPPTAERLQILTTTTPGIIQFLRIHLRAEQEVEV